jgi:thioredoxin reductase (NADPH)
MSLVLPKALIIVGAGPAGFTAGHYAARANLDVLLLGLPGGLGASVEWVDNFPALTGGIAGFDLVERMRQQAITAGLHMEEAEVSRVTQSKSAFTLESSAGHFSAQTVIVATGAFPSTLGVPGERELRGKGVSYCATCDGPFFRGKRVLVVGGGDSAVQEALSLAKVASHVTLVHRRDALRAASCLQTAAARTPNLEIAWNTTLSRIEGLDRVRSVILRDVHSGQERTQDTEGVFIYVGLKPNSRLVEGLAALDTQGAILTDPHMATSVPGLFAAGDVRATPLRQFVTACSDGALATMSAIDTLQRLL